MRVSLFALLIMFLVSAFAVGAAVADGKSECLRGISMIKRELSKNHPDDVRERLRQALSNAQNEELENDWSECSTYIADARKAVRK